MSSFVGFTACLIIGGSAVAATKEIWEDVFSDIREHEPMWLSEVLHERFKFFMEFELRDKKTDLYVIRQVYKAFEEIRNLKLLPLGHAIYGFVKDILFEL